MTKTRQKLNKEQPLKRMKCIYTFHPQIKLNQRERQINGQMNYNFNAKSFSMACMYLQNHTLSNIILNHQKYLVQKRLDLSL